jgi:uncharacterized iron-regulated protein
MDQRNVFGRAFQGMAVLAGYELAGKRLGRSLAGDGEHESSRFSDNTLADFVNALRGIRNVYYGSADTDAGAGFAALVGRLDPDINKKRRSRRSTSLTTASSPRHPTARPAPRPLSPLPRCASSPMRCRRPATVSACS